MSTPSNFLATEMYLLTSGPSLGLTNPHLGGPPRCRRAPLPARKCHLRTSGRKKSSVDHFGTYRCVRGSCQEGAVWSRHVWRVPFTSWDLVLPRLSQSWRNISQTSWWRFTSREAVVSLFKASSSLARLIVLCRPSSPNRTTRIFSAELPWKSLHHWYLCSTMKVVTFLVGEFI